LRRQSLRKLNQSILILVSRSETACNTKGQQVTMSHTLLESRVAILINRILAGEPVETGELPSNGECPDWQQDLVWKVFQADDPMSVYRKRVNTFPHPEAIEAQVFRAGSDHWTGLGDRKESHLKRKDYITALESLGYYFQLNDCTDRVEVNGIPITDVKESQIKSDLRNIGLRQVNVARDHYIAHANIEGKYHPVHKYLDRLEWDGRGHIAKLASYFDDKHGAFPFILRRFLIGAVAKSFLGERNRMLVLDGSQYLGKSYFVRWLVPERMRKEHYLESPINPDIKDHRIRLVSTWIWEVAELGSTTRRADREALKHFLSMQQVTVRVPYAHFDINKPALSSFVGTINNEAGFLNDPTGHTRYMTVHLEDIDWSYSKEVDINQVWAEAYHAYKAEETWRLEGHERETVQKINEGYEISDPLTDLIATLFEVDPSRGDWWLATNKIREILKREDWALRTPRGESMAISSELSRLGCEPKRGSDPENGARVRGYQGIRYRLKNEKEREIPGF